MSSRCVIVGAGHGAGQLCASLIASTWEGTITLIGDEPLLPYHRPPLSKTQLDPERPADVQLLRPESFYGKHGINVMTGTRVESVNRSSKSVRVEGRSIPYDRLVLATGSVHRVPPIKGIDHARVHGLRTAEEAAALRARIPGASRVVVIGAGFIGLEVAASLRKLGLGVTVLEIESRVLSRVTSPEVSAYFEALHRDRGVDLRTGTRALEIREAPNGLEVVTEDGGALACDFAVMGAGAAPNTALAEEAGLDVRGGIRVNAFNGTSDPAIYALGDVCVQFQPRYQSDLRLESVQNALDQAKTVAAALTGHPVPHRAVPWFWSDQYDVKLQIVGVASGYDTVVLRGQPDPGASFSAWYFHRDELLAVDAVDDTAAYAVATKLLKTGKQPLPEQVSDLAIETKALLTHAREVSHA